MDNQQKIKKLAEASSELGEIGLLAIESEKRAEADRQKARKILTGLDYREAKDYLEIMNSLETKQPAFYIEPEEKLNDLVWEIVREYQGGIVSLMDRQNHTGLKTIKFLSKESPFVLVLTRGQMENSPPGLFEYIGPIESI